MMHEKCLIMRKPSASCSALVALVDDHDTLNSPQKLLSVCESSPLLYHGDLLVAPTSLRLDDNEKLHIPVKMQALDEYLQSIPKVSSRSQELLASKAKCIQDDGNVRYLNLLQGEMAHATSKDADVLCSSEATTCHILAVYSSSPTENLPLASLAHIDKVGYDSCLLSMVKEHIQHHQRNNQDDFGFYDEEGNEEKDQFIPLNDASLEGCTQDKNLDLKANSAPSIEMEIHLLGGFLDSHGKSQELSNSLLLAFSKLAEKFQDSIRMKMATAAISCMNSCRATLAPVGRGLGIDTRTGKVFTVNSIPSHLAGPALQVRLARIFRSDNRQEERLQVIHHSTSNGRLCIEPFDYEHFPQLDTLATLPDESLLQLTSTSPQVEAEGFCDSMRSTIGFIKRVPSCEVFGGLCDEPLVYRRSKSANALNEWALCT